jgi:hypothetical protein
MGKEVVFACGKERIELASATDVFVTFLSSWDVQVREFGRLAKMLNHQPWTMIYTRLGFTNAGKLPSLKSLLQEVYPASLSHSSAHSAGVCVCTFGPGRG